MVHKKSNNKETGLGKSKIKILAPKPEVQQTDLTFVHEPCQTSYVGHVLICLNLRMHFRCILRFLKKKFKTTN